MGLVAMRVHLSTTGYMNQTRWWNPIQSPPPTATDVSTATGKQTLVMQATPTIHTQVKFAQRCLSSPFSLSVVQWSRECYAAVINDKGGHAEDTMMYCMVAHLCASRTGCLTQVQKFLRVLTRWKDTEPSFLLVFLLISSSGRHTGKYACQFAVRPPSLCISSALLKVSLPIYSQPCECCDDDV